MTSAQMATEALVRAVALARQSQHLANGKLAPVPEILAPMAQLASATALRMAWAMELAEAESHTRRP
jgi:hypothetical protein